MATDLIMPALSPTMEKGTLAKWPVAVGDAVRPGDLLAEIETDKATMKFEAADGGRVAELVVPEGTDDVSVGTVIVRLSDGDAGAEAASATMAVDPEGRAGKVGKLPPRIVDRTASAGNAPSPPAGRGGESARTGLNVELDQRGVKLSIKDMLMKAMAAALAEVPDANVQFDGDQLHRFDRVDLSVAVAVDGGLVTPVVRDVVALSLSERVRELADRARAGKLGPPDYERGTASISNLGMFGVDGMVPVINPPQALVLGIGAGVEQPWKVDGAVGLATAMTATASFDHRAIDGAVAARFISAFRERVEDPWLICC